MKKEFIIVIVFLISSCSSGKTNLTGIWQSSPHVAAGWNDAYQMFEDGQFVFNYSQMVCDKRIISIKGDWKTNKEELVLIIKQKTIHEGGTLVPAMGSCGSEFEIEGGEIKTINLDEPEVVRYSISTIELDSINRLETITMDDRKFWKMDVNPMNYQ